MQIASRLCESSISFCIRGVHAAMESSPGKPGDAPVHYQPPESNAIRRLTAWTCILAVAAAATGLVLFLLQRNQEKCIIRASELAEDRLERLARDEMILRASDVAILEKEVIVFPGAGERYSREVTIDPGAGPARITVTVAWETITGESHVRMCRRLNAGARDADGNAPDE